MTLLSVARHALHRVVERVTRRRQLRKALASDDDDFRSTTRSSFCCETPPAAAWTSSGTSSSSLASPAAAHNHNLRLEGWMYWVRYDAAASRPAAPSSYAEFDEAARTHQTATKVYAVLRNEFLLLYRDNRRCAKGPNAAPLIQIAVERAGRAIDGAFHVFDPHGEEMELHLYRRRDEQLARQWAEALEHAAELTHAYFATFELRVQDLARGSLYRGTLRDFRSQQRASWRQSARHERLASLRSSVLASTVLSSSSQLA